MSQRRKFEFEGHAGEQLAGLLELPDTAPGTSAVGTALFAHCFTCGKDIAAASRISRALVKRGYAVMRFDFTGLGNSDGDFANTNFSSNVQDLLAAAAHLRTEGMAPQLLIGHSLGGTAVLNAAHDIPECVGVVTIGAPADATHVAKQFTCDIATIEASGEATVNLAGREFLIRKQFLDDINQTTHEHLARLQPALLVMHSPIDATVSIHEAERIYTAARHPKSFVSLDDADHLLTRAADAEYVATIIAAWAGKRLQQAEPSARPDVGAGAVLVSERDHRFQLDVLSDTHRWIADEPRKVGGRDAGPDPYEHLLAAVGTCTAMTLRMYAGRKSWPLEDATVVLRHTREHQADCEHCDEAVPESSASGGSSGSAGSGSAGLPGSSSSAASSSSGAGAKLDVIEREISLRGALDEKQRRRLMEIADRCPVHRTLTGSLEIRTREAHA